MFILSLNPLETLLFDLYPLQIVAITSPENFQFCQTFCVAFV